MKTGQIATYNNWQVEIVSLSRDGKKAGVRYLDSTETFYVNSKDLK